MKKYFLPSSLLFYLFFTLVFFIIGTAIAGISGAGEGQGLAAGAIVLGYGFVIGVLALVASVLIVRFANKKRIVKLNQIFGALLFILIIYLIYRYNTRPYSSGNETSYSPRQQTIAVAGVDFASNGKNELIPIGLGMATPDFFNNPKIYFYNNPNLEKSVLEHSPYDSLVFSRTERGYEISYAPPWFVPAHLKIDYEILYLRFLSITREFAEVIVNETDGKTLFMNRDKLKIKFFPDFLLSLNSVEIKNPSDFPLRIKPLSHSSPVSKEYTFLRPFRASGEWLQVELLDNDLNGTGFAWLRWQRNGELLINYSLLM